MAEGEINIDNIIQRLLEGETMFYHFDQETIIPLASNRGEVGSVAADCNRKWRQMVQKFLKRKNSTLQNVKLVPIFVEQEMNSFLFCDPLKRHWPLDSRVWIVLKVDRCEF